MSEVVYWFKDYQIDNTSTVSDNAIKLTTGFNEHIMQKFLFGNGPASEGNIRDFFGDKKQYEIVSFLQNTNLGTLNAQLEVKCIFTLIIRKQSAGSISIDNQITDMWLGILYPKVICGQANISEGDVKFWKINVDTIPMKKVMWAESGVANAPKFGYLSWNGSNGDKVLIGIVQNAFYLSPLSFYLEGRHEDILKRMPSLKGIGISNRVLN